ncbi:MAG: class I SAM-dependent methyltransferase [Clostridia bacterium]|nr:class I SAM-dependent methyltransferase [Clostridia bacterium]
MINRLLGFVNEAAWDRKLKVSTCGEEAGQADRHRHPYEPTPYTVLARLAESGWIDASHTLVDYGCGKGRVAFYLHYTLGCRVIGVELDEGLWRQAEDNRARYPRPQGVSFVCRAAEEYEVEEADCFYFFNPFSVEIFRAVLGRVMESWYRCPRRLRLFCYYPDDEYLRELLSGRWGGGVEVRFAGEIDCGDLFVGEDARERIVVFEME